MTRKEIEKAIENGESVWVVFKDNIDARPNLLCEVDKQNIVAVSDIGLIYFNKLLNSNHRVSFSQCFKTQAEALHYANHANWTRLEKFPFLAWEEFLEEKEIEFTDKSGVLTWLYIVENKTPNIQLENKHEKLKMWDLTEANFYEAYDECLKRFLGLENLYKPQVSCISSHFRRF